MQAKNNLLQFVTGCVRELSLVGHSGKFEGTTNISKLFETAKYTGIKKPLSNGNHRKKKSLSTLAKTLSEPINNKNLQVSKKFCSIAKVNRIFGICK